MMKVVNYFYLSPNKYHQIFYRKGDSIRAVISSVEIVNNRLCSLLRKTFRVRNSEVFDGFSVVKGIARVKSKVAVESYDDRIDPVGTCVVLRVRINGVVRELKNENIDL
jgi:N utilization substance protein A